MTTRDELTLALHQHINVNDLIIASKEGSLLSYYSGVVEKLARAGLITRPQESVRSGDAVETRSNPETVRPAIPQSRRVLFESGIPSRTMEQQINRLDNSPVGREIPVSVRESIRREVMDGIRVSNL